MMTNEMIPIADFVTVLKPAQIGNDFPDLKEHTDLMMTEKPIRLCKAAYDRGVLLGTLSVPKKSRPIQDKLAFGFVLKEGRLYFIAEDSEFEDYLQKFSNEYAVVKDSPFGYLLRFMNYVIQEDVYFLEDYNEQLEQIEHDVYEGKGASMEGFIMMARRDMNILGNYYLQMTAVGQMMQEADISTDQSGESAMISLFLSRSGALQTLVDTIKDNTDQIWSLYQTQQSDRQNKIGTLLTIISGVFLPLSFLTGWYGMNFQDMPLIKSHKGYLIVIVVAIVILLLEFWYIRKHRWLSLKEKPKSKKAQKRTQAAAQKLAHAYREDRKDDKQTRKVEHKENRKQM